MAISLRSSFYVLFLYLSGMKNQKCIKNYGRYKRCFLLFQMFFCNQYFCYITGKKSIYALLDKVYNNVLLLDSAYIFNSNATSLFHGSWMKWLGVMINLPPNIFSILSATSGSWKSTIDWKTAFTIILY